MLHEADAVKKVFVCRSRSFYNLVELGIVFSLLFFDKIHPYHQSEVCVDERQILSLSVCAIKKGEGQGKHNFYARVLVKK